MTNFKKLFGLILILTIGTVLTLAGCKGGGSATKPTQVVKPTPTTKPMVKKPSTDLSILANHFATKKYDGDTKQYTIDDIIAPKKIISALTNTKISYIKLLRNEILARRGYVFKPEKSKLHGLKLEDIKEILQPTKWYSINPDFIYADLTKIEIANVSFLKKLEKIDLIGGERARQLAAVLDIGKENINTYEAIKVYKATKKADVLTTLSKEIILFKTKAKQNYDKWIETSYDDSYDDKKAQSLSSLSLINNAKFIINFKVGDRMLLKSNGDILLVECLKQMMTNTNWMISTSGNIDEVAYPNQRILRVDNDIVELTNGIQYRVTKKIGDDLYPFSISDDSENILYKGNDIFSIGLDGGGGFWKGANGEEFNRWYSWVMQKKNSLYVLVPFNVETEDMRFYIGGYYLKEEVGELLKYARKKKFSAGTKIFKITILEYGRTY